MLKGEHTVAGFCPRSLTDSSPSSLDNYDAPLGVGKVGRWLKNTATRNTTGAGLGKARYKQPGDRSAEGRPVGPASKPDSPSGMSLPKCCSKPLSCNAVCSGAEGREEGFKRGQDPLLSAAL